LYASLAATLLAAIPCVGSPQDGTSLLFILRSNGRREASCTKISNVLLPDKAAEFILVNGDRDINNYGLDAGGNLVYSPPPPAPPGPLPESFEQAVLDDVAAGALSVQIVQYLPTLHKVGNNETRRKALWAKVTASPPAWLPAAAITRIETHASTANMPLK